MVCVGPQCFAETSPAYPRNLERGISAFRESGPCPAARRRLRQGNPAMRENDWLAGRSPAFRLALASSVLAPENWRERQEASIRAICSDGPDWTEYLRLVDRHRTPAISWAVLKRVPGLEIPATASAELQKRSDACRMRAFRHSQVLITVLKSFDQAGIPAMPLKGPLLSLEIYGDVGLRQSKDLDLAVPFQHLRLAGKCLQEMGWGLSTEDASLSPRQWKFRVRHGHHVTYLHPRRTCQLELHWRASWDTPEMTARRWDRAIPSQWNGCPFRAMNPVDLILYLCNHGGAHAWTRAKWLGDLARMTMAANVDWKAVIDEAQTAHQERPVLACLILLERTCGIPLPEVAASRVPRIPRRLIHKSLRELNCEVEAHERGNFERMLAQIRSIGYLRQLWPDRTVRQSLIEFAVCPLDFDELRLPDKLFWLYVPLRPVLWVRRHIR